MSRKAPIDRPKKPRGRFSGGVRFRELPGKWRQDWRRSYAVLTRDHADDQLPTNWFRRGWYRIKTFFLELSYKMPPARRLLFVLCLVLTFLGTETETVGPFQEEIEVWQHPELLLIAVIGLIFLLIFELADRVQVRDELEIARQLQNDLLPQAAPGVSGYEFVFSYRSANTVGGDYYDFIELADGRLAFAMGDASGHGIAAAMLMAISNSTLRLAVDIDPEPGAVAKLVNRALVASGGKRAFLTLFYALLDPETGSFEYVCAGHPFPFLRSRTGGVARLGTGSFPLGLRKQIEPSEGRATLAKGDLLCLYTDGIPEAIDELGEAFGFDRLQSLVEPGGTPSEVHHRVLDDLATFLGEEPLVDDRSLMVIGRG
jgi:hypothetical protein